MGCSASKIEDVAAVCLCRERCKLMEETVHESYVLADAHAAYMHSLKSVGHALLSFSHHQIQHSFKQTNSYSSHHSHCNFAAFSHPQNLPPPPPPPTSSTWDFLNFFEMFDLTDVAHFGYATQTELVNSQQDFQDKCDLNVKREAEDDTKRVSGNTETGKNGVSEVMREIQALFDRAAESGNHISEMLRGAKFHFCQKSSVQQVSSKLLQAFSPSLSRVSSFRSSTPKSTSEPSPFSTSESLSISGDEDLGINLSSLSSTLKKLCMLEKKLYHEVKVEEKLCMTYQTKCRQLKHLQIKGAKSRKVEEMQTLLKTISTKIKIAIQVVDKLAITGNKLRDEELWTRITEFIQGLYEMWKAISECHKSQSQAVADSNYLDDILCNGKLTDASFEAALHLKYELLNWSLSFSNWIRSQRDFVKSLNNWVRKCYIGEPEIPQDGAVPLSPGRVSPVLLICDHWSLVTGALSEKEITDTMKFLFLSVDKLLKEHYAGIQQRVDIDINLERKLRNMEREEQKYQKIMQARLKKMPLNAGESDIVLDTETEQQTAASIPNSSRSRLKLIFEALYKFTTNSIQAYEELTLLIKVGQPANGEGQ